MKGRYYAIMKKGYSNHMFLIEIIVIQHFGL